jgi:sugar/nucleoside kinase (ribokinase family)
MSSPDLVLLGNLLVDDLVFPDGRTRMGQAGGAMLYASLASALWGAKVGCVSLRGDDYPEAALAQLAERGVMLDGVVPLRRRGLRTWLLYEGALRRVVHQLGCPTHEEVSPDPDAVPAAWRGAKAFHLAPMPIGVQQRLVQALGAGGAHIGQERPDLALGAGGAHISIDPYELVTEATLPRWREVLAHADAFFPSEDELRLDGAQADPRAAIKRLAGGRLRFVVFKRGADGGILYDTREDRFHEWDARTHGVVDPTGAGDSFAAGFLCAHLEGRPVPECLERGVVGASFAIEAWGPAGLLAATRADAEARLSAWHGREATT